MNIFSEEKIKIFESVWLDENKYRNFDSNNYLIDSLSDSDYIDYHIWEDMNWILMYKKHLPKARVIKGKNPNIIFHGGCLGCISQRNHGIDRCKECGFFRSNGSNSNLFIPGEKASTMNGDDFKEFLS